VLKELKVLMQEPKVDKELKELKVTKETIASL
jgi:hypothetical protein